MFSILLLNKASMAAWMRIKYPHLIAGSVASSGPVFAKVDKLYMHRMS